MGPLLCALYEMRFYSPLSVAAAAAFESKDWEERQRFICCVVAVSLSLLNGTELISYSARQVSMYFDWKGVSHVVFRKINTKTVAPNIFKILTEFCLSLYW